MHRNENIENNMEFLVKKLQKEWDVSKETKHIVTVSVEEAKAIWNRVHQQTADIGEMLQSKMDMSFRESMELCKDNYVSLRVARKLLAGFNAAEDAGMVEYVLSFDKEEFSCFRKLAKSE